MTALLYLAVAVLAAVLPTRAWLLDKNDPARGAFLAFGWAVTVTYTSFCVSLLPGLEWVRVIYVASGVVIPASSFWFFERWMTAPDSPASPQARNLGLLGVGMVVMVVVVDTAFFPGLPRTSPADIISAFYIYGTLVYLGWRLYRAYLNAARVDQVRLRYVVALALAATGLSVTEQLARTLSTTPDNQLLSLSDRLVALQGPIPPFSVLFVGLLVFTLYQTLVLSRLLDLHELFSRVLTLVVSASVLVLVDGVTVIWVGTFTDYPAYSTFQIFLASLLFLAAYGAVNDTVALTVNRVINRRGQQLTEALDTLRELLPTVISAPALTRLVLSRLHASGRAPKVSLYLWNAGLDAFVCAGERGGGDHPPLSAVAPQPFTQGFLAGEPHYSKAWLQARTRRGDAESADRLAMMEAMNAELTLPILSGELVLGWLNLCDEDWSDGYSEGEIERLRKLANQVSVLVNNLHDFEALKEEHRLRALGKMAAGLAHEIRNPLAGIKGAAQFLQDEELGETAKDMLEVVIDETDRLNVVVSQFLDYARPFELHLGHDHVNALVDHVATLTRARGLPDTLTLDVQLAGDLPSMEIDRTKLAQVLINLVENALQAMDGTGTLTLRTARHTNRGMELVELVVQDDGPGIDAETMQNLFIPFYTTKDSGSGLGLAISQRIVQAHQGELDVQSTPGHGATFTIRLPILTLPDQPSGADL